MDPQLRQPDRRGSLLGRLAEVRLVGGDWRIAAALAALIAVGPGATFVGARLLAERVRSDTIALERASAPRLAMVRAQEAARAELRPLLTQPGLVATLNSLARALPDDARLNSAARADSGLRVEVLVSDPDRLRGALRRDPATAMLRDAGQQRSEGGMSVTLESRR
jgi:hypothetical protein